MTDFITGLLTALSPANLWSGAVELAPLWAIIIIFSLSAGFISSLVEGAGKGKPRL